MSQHQFQLPRSDGAWLIDPAPEQWAALTARNHSAFSAADFDCQGRSFAELRRHTQHHVGRAAARYTAELLGENVAVPESPQWIVTGHQPELFHPGVWVKNFAVHRLARQCQANGLNLIVDHDTHAGLEIAVPIGTRAAPRTVRVPFDDARPVCSWEELPLIDRSRFDEFAAHVAEPMRPWGFEPLLTQVWPLARRYAERVAQPRLCNCLAGMRAGVERNLGAGNLELPMSRLAESSGFLWFAAHLFAQLPRFAPLHNEIVRDYRRRHRLRSRTHPVPDLAVEDDWREAPFWVWRAGESKRDRLFARQTGPELWLRDRHDVFLKLPLSPDRSACCAVEQLATLPARNIRLRSRALTTTLFARLFLADLFVHGIGGAKYDEMTDELIARFYGLPVPAYATISATLHLPLGDMWSAGPTEIGWNAHELRQLNYQPERFAAEPDAGLSRLIAEKRALIEAQQLSEAGPMRDGLTLVREQNRRRYDRLKQLNRVLQPLVREERRRQSQRREELLARQAANRILGNREFAWALFPEDRLRAFLETLSIGAGTEEA